MLLETVGKINAISEKLREEVEQRVLSFGNSVRYQFNISKPNPDPEKRAGQFIWPHIYTLQPRTFVITDPYAKRGLQSAIKVGLVNRLDEKGEKVELWGKVQIEGQNRGMIECDLTTPEGIATAMYLEMHPKNADGVFSSDMYKVFSRIDEQKYSAEKRAERSLRKKAMDIAEAMSDSEVMKFAAAMSWTETKVEILRNDIEEMAEQEPAYFLELHAEGGKTIEYQAAVQKAKDKGEIVYNGVDNTYTWKNGKVITMLAVESSKTDIEQMAVWLETGGEQAQQAYKKIQSLIK